MNFCPNCGAQVPSNAAKFCSGCGSSISGPQIVQQQTVKPTESQVASPKLIGIIKELENDEKVVTQSITQTEVIFVKEAFIKKVLGQERKEVPISISGSMFYLTNQRLIFLKLFELSASELGQDSNLLAGAGGTFYELPLTSITGVEMRQVKLNKNDEARFVNIFGGDVSKLRRPALEIIYDEKAAKGRAKDYMESMMQRGIISKLWGKVEMVYDKIFVLGEQAVVLQPTLSEYVKVKNNMR
ncbi:zinc-ribbon domain [Candidatus Nitrososphaera evergladensis SR1]|jgi:hypothetical protein|uniref:Zinc-ribbon domain n=1 Tax=Candidatus Nitrososphaera evergladensis SR1 TaxID=1459636 RepID=A0A075MWM5_9ARCH|nr:zinc ribbon domain-containing protein [Candidatus Nitrososphaera evergladensis]AIF83669.1 zinc-ribbon domain [Candidatus Nitrososphaera evergladensis SR1]